MKVLNRQVAIPFVGLRRRSGLRFQLGVLGLLLWVSLPAGWAQLATSSISGSARDSSGAVMPGVSITVRNVETGITRTAQTNATGRYSVSNLAPGDYEVQAELSGFQAEVRRGITLTLGREAVVDFALQVGQVQEQVVVTGEAPLVDTTSATVAGLVDQQQVTDLPLNGRSLTQLTTLQPGVLLYRGGSSALTGVGENISIGGARTRQINFLLNGTSTLNFFGKSPGGISGNQLGVEGVREFTVLTNAYSAEYGKSAGGVINAITKSGTNTFHGSLFEYLRNSALDARRFFDKDEPPSFKRNQFGASLGGPLRRDRTFFFANIEFLRERLGQTQQPSFPTARSRSGIAPDGSSFTVSTALQPYLALVPLPNGPDLGDGYARHIFTVTQPTDQNYLNARIDHQFSDADSVFGSYVLDDSDRRVPGATEHLWDKNPYRSQYASLEENHIFSPTVLNTAHFGFNRSKAILDPKCSEALLRLTFNPNSRACPRSNFTGLSANFGPRIFIVNSFQYSDTLAWTRGEHQFKFGGSYERFRVNGLSQISPGGLYQFLGGVVNALSANVQFFEAPFPGQDFWRGLRQNLFALFANDSIRLRPNLNVNLGLRYEFVNPPTEVNGKLANIYTLTSPAPHVGEPYFENPSLLNFSPRVGIAWSPGASQNTSIRAGFGIFYDQLLHHVWLDGPFQAPPFWGFGRAAPSAGNPVPFPNAYDLFLRGTVASSPTFIFAVEGNPAQTYLLQYNLSVQRQLPGQVVVMLAYVGSGGRHLARIIDNQAYPTIQSDGRIFFPPTSVRRNPNFAEFRLRHFDSNSSYNSFQMAVRRRYSAGVGFQLSYTWSKSIDVLSDMQGRGDLPNDQFFATLYEFREIDRGRSAFDARHNFSANFTADIPFGKNLTGIAGKLAGGWQVQSILSLQTGLPTAVTLGTFDNARTRSTRDQFRPHLNPGFTADDVVLGAPNRTKDPNGRYLAPNAFSLPDPGYWGNLGRGVFSGPGLATLDFSLIKNTALTERANLEFRTEFFNLFNRPNFGFPSQTVFDRAGQTAPIGTFATITSTSTSARQIQFALRLAF